MKTSRFFRYSSLACMLSLMAISVACSNANSSESDAEPQMKRQRPDKELKALMKSISEGDANNFASICVYPINRPYPLREIEDSATMVDYFPIMADENLREKARVSKVEDWEDDGWKGWSLGDTTLLRYDEGLQFVDYVSPAETGLRKILAREEIMSLQPEYRGDWSPVVTLIEVDGNRIFRIDSEGDEYRLMEYDKAEDMRSKPILVLLGKAETEGSAEYVTYTFTDSIGNEAVYMPDAEPPVSIYITNPDKKEFKHKVRRGYWRDYLR